MSKRKSYNFIIPLVLYPYDFMISIGESDRQFLNSCVGFIDVDKYKEDLEGLINWEENLYGACLSLPFKFTIIKIKKKPDNPEYAGVLHHEIFHAVFSALNRIGMCLSKDSEEAYAYLIGYVTEQVFLKLQK